MHRGHINITKSVIRMEIYCFPCYSFVQHNCAADLKKTVSQYRGLLNIIAYCRMSYIVAHI